MNTNITASRGDEDCHGTATATVNGCQYIFGFALYAVIEMGAGDRFHQPW
jgi:hypothetical protein